jgi:hypothetical protein
VKANQQYATWKRLGSGWGVYVPSAVSANPQLGDTVEVLTASTNQIKSVVITAIVKRSDAGTVCACQQK